MDFELSDEELETITRALISHANMLRADFEKVATFEAPELIRAAAAEMYNKEVEPISKLHVRLQQERISRGLVTDTSEVMG